METNDSLDNDNIRGIRERDRGLTDETIPTRPILNNSQSIPSDECNNPCLDEINKIYTQVQDLLLKASTIQASAATLAVGDEYKVYYDRIVRPSLDIIYLLSFSVQNTAAAANLYQTNTYGKKGETKRALDVSYDILEQIELSLDLLRNSLACLIEKSKCL
ncbi:hypothetical protein [Clostridium sp. LIBA-8841]|uniref:hypothetical protein n=1 Tax=Clostridium sp. LIBA-8841 TaxID=2987530 RepID=UPI002AC6DB16|nr:hypothetical protein [Clostridium sp. LIBA-8841]MDZ5252904.1 hypothetical protein [Clostridium sp. LIBA-8841]